MAVTTSAPDRSATPSDNETLRANQVRQAEELLFSGHATGGFAKALFRGNFEGKALFPYPDLTDAERPTVERSVAEVKAFADAHIDAAAIDRDADIPVSVIKGLADLGVLGMAAPVEMGGRGFSQMGYCRIMEVIGGHCAATAVFVNAHHSIGLRALVLSGRPNRRDAGCRRWPAARSSRPSPSPRNRPDRTPATSRRRPSPPMTDSLTS